MPLYLLISTDISAPSRDYTLRGPINAPVAKLAASAYAGPNPLITELNRRFTPAGAGPGTVLSFR
jgi:hypothetical protein